MYFRARYYDPELGRFISQDPCGYVDGMSLYCGYFAMCGDLDPTGLIKRDANGNIIFIPSGDPIEESHGNGKGQPPSTNLMQPGYVTADDGTRIAAYKNLTNNKNWNADCHGTTFADGKYWIENDQVIKPLTGDGYRLVMTPARGDVAVYSDQYGIEHSVTITGFDPSGTAMGYGKGGIEPEAYTKPIPPGANGAWSDPNAQVAYYHKGNP